MILLAHIKGLMEVFMRVLVALRQMVLVHPLILMMMGYSLQYGTFITVDGKYVLDGYGVTVVNDMWVGDSIIRLYERYLTDDDFENPVKYTINKVKVMVPII